MGLLLKLNNGDSQLKSLKFGNDRPGGGDSGQPYIKKGIQTGIQNPSLYNDFVVRGGIEAPLSAAEDVARLAKYFINIKNPSGLLFTAKQNLLSRVGTKTEASKGLGYAGGALNEGAYTPLSTLAEAGIVWAGGHVNKQGLDPTGIFPGLSIKKYGDVAYENNNEKTNSSAPAVPDSLYRKAQKANNRLGNRIGATANQRDKTISELTYRPPTQVNFSTSPDASARPSNLVKFQNKINSFLEAWDAYRDKQAAKNLTNKVQREARASERALIADQNLDEAEFFANNIARPVYSNRLLNLWDTTGLNLTSPGYTNSSVLYSYGGGPNSILGIGKTNIKFATLNDGATPARTGMNMVDPYLQYGRRSVEYKTTNVFGKTFMPNSFGSVSLTYAGTYNTNIKEDQLFGTPDYLVTYNNKNDLQTFNPNAIWQNSKTSFNTWQQLDFTTQEVNLDSITKEDFRTILDPSLPSNKTFLSISPSYTDKNIEDYLNLGNPGRKGNISSYTEGKRDLTTQAKLGPVDKINASPIYKTNTKDSSRYSAGDPGGVKNSYTDIIPFYIAILNNDSQKGGTYKKYMHFRAFIDSFSDSYDADWKDIEYMGRAEKFHKYGGFSRKISMAFTVVAQSREEITIMYDKLNFLASSLAPEYLDSYTSGYMAGNIAYITLGGYLNEQPGIITSLTFDIPEESPWEIGIDDNGNPLPATDIRQMPHMIKVTGINFIPIHKFRPEKQSFRNDQLGTDSTRLLSTGEQRYVDQLRPKSANYDKEQMKQELNEAIIAEREAEKIALLNYASQNILLANSSFLSVDPNQAQTPSGIDNVVNNQGLINFNNE
jgi:hypothetical protein